MTAPHEDTPEWDEIHDGYAVDYERVVVVMGGGRQFLEFTSAGPGFKIRPLELTPVILAHGQTGTLETLEALHGVVSESLARERKLQAG